MVSYTPLAVLFALGLLQHRAVADASLPNNVCEGLEDKECEEQRGAKKHLDINHNETIDGAFTTGSLRIPRERNLSLQDYYEKYEKTQTPVIIEDYSDVLKGMSEENIMRTCGHVEVPVTRIVANSTTEQKDKATLDAGGTRDDLNDVMRLVAEQSTKSTSGDFEAVPGSIMGVFIWNIQEHCPELLAELIMPKYLAQDLLQRVPSNIGLMSRDAYPFLSVGVDASYGGKERDMLGSDFWMFVSKGAKEWHIADSIDRYNFFARDAHQARHFHDVVNKGELIIIPGNSWQQMRNKGTALTLSGNFIGHGGFDMLKSKLKSIPRYSELRVLLQPEFDATVDYDQGDMTWEQFKDQGIPNLKPLPPIPSRRETFEAIDANGDDKLSKEEIEAHFAKEGRPIPVYEDKDEDGFIAWGEFVKKVIADDTADFMPESIFEIMDINDDFKLSMEEARAVFSEKGVGDMFAKEDVDGDGYVSWEEFQGPKGEADLKKRRELFDMIDADGDRGMSKQEVEAYLKSNKKTLPGDRFMKADRNGDGVVTWDEFKVKGTKDEDRESKANVNVAQGEKPPPQL